MSNPRINNNQLRARNAMLLDDIKTLITPDKDENSEYHKHYMRTFIKWVEYFQKEKDKRKLKA